MDIRIEDKYLGMLIDQHNFTGKLKYPEEVIKIFKQRIFQISEAKDSQDLRKIKSLHVEKLKELRYNGKYSMRLNKAYRIIFRLGKEGKTIEIVIIEEINNHYG